MISNSLLDQILSTPGLDWVAMITALIYVYLAGKDNNWCWPFAGVSSLIYAHQVFFVYQLPSDAVLQLFYFAMAVVGLYRWRKKPVVRPKNEMLDSVALQPDRQPDPDITRMSPAEHVWVVVGAMIGGLFFGQVVVRLYADAALPLLDAITTVASVIATFLLIWRRLENWLYFIVIDLVYVYIYLSRDAWLFALLMVIYVFMAAYGYYNWRRMLSIDRSHQASG